MISPPIKIIYFSETYMIIGGIEKISLLKGLSNIKIDRIPQIFKFNFSLDSGE